MVIFAFTNSARIEKNAHRYAGPASADKAVGKRPAPSLEEIED
jgi:hypothetical protein